MPPIDIISMAQQARPNVTGHTELLRTQFTAKSRVVSNTPSGCFEAVVDFLQFGAIFGAAFERSKKIAVAFLDSPHTGILPLSLGDGWC